MVQASIFFKHVLRLRLMEVIIYIGELWINLDTKYVLCVYRPV